MSGSRERQLRMELENGNEIIHDRVVTSGQSALSCATGGKNPDLVGSSLPVVTHPKKGKSKRGTMAKRNQNSNPKIIPVYERPEPLKSEDVKCPICCDILFKPVTFPCMHSLCLDCFTTHAEKTSLYCPLCRFRLSVWSRAASKNKSFVNEAFWKRIRDEFPEEILIRENGSETLTNVSPQKQIVRDGTIAHEGEIFQEFDEELKRFREEEERNRLKEEAASLDLIRRLQEMEGPLPVVQCSSEIQEDMKLAQKLQAELERTGQDKSVLPSGRSTRKTVQSDDKSQAKLEFKQPSLPASASATMGESSIVPLVESVGNAGQTFSLEEDFKLAKKLQLEERKAVELERLQKLERMNTRLHAKSKSANMSGSIKRVCNQYPTHSPKRRKQDRTQRTLDKFFSASPPSAAAGAPPRSPSNSSDGTNKNP